MTLPGNIRDREYLKFDTNASGEVIVRNSSSITNDEGTEPAKITNGGLDVNIQDQFTPEVSVYMMYPEIEDATLASPTALNDFVIILNAGHGAIAGQTICLKESKRFFQAKILSISVNDITLDTPLDFAFSMSTDVCIGNSNLAVLGSPAVPIIFRVTPPYGTVWDVTRIMISMTDATAMDDGKFGGIPALTNGVVLRTVDGIYKNHFNAKTNGDISRECFDAAYTSKAPAGQYGFRARRTYAGPSKSGVTLRLSGDNNDELQMIVRDDLSALTDFRIRVHGHVVE